MLTNRIDCMFLLPPELTGEKFNLCGVFHDICNGESDCVARVRHTPESRQALADAIEIVKARGGKYPVDTEHGGVI